MSYDDGFRLVSMHVRFIRYEKQSIVVYTYAVIPT